MSATLSYVFCLVRNARRPTLRAVREGMPGGTDLRAIEVGDQLWAIVQTVPESDYGEAELERGLQNLDWVGARAVAHERVIESFLSSTALLPMQLFTLFTSDDRVVQHVRGDRAHIARILKRVERKVEWGLRLTHTGPKGSGGAGVARPRTGTTYLARKRDALDVNRRKLGKARTAADRVFRTLRGKASASQRRTGLERAAPESKLLLDAAFLVPSAKSGAFRSAVRQQAGALREAGVALSLTGPWPAYNFIK